MRKLLVLTVLFAGLLLVSCGEDGSPTTADLTVDGASLLRLVNNDTLIYLRTDTAVYIDSTYHYDVTESFDTITITGSGDEWVFRRGADPGINVKIGSQSVLLAGYRRNDDTVEIVTYFAEPPTLVHRSLSAGDTWTGYTPSYTSASGSLRMPLYFANFGFHFERTYVGVEPVTVTSGEYNAYKYESDLFINAGDSLPVAHVVEYYALNLGLVRVQFRGGGLIRTLSLVDPS